MHLTISVAMCTFNGARYLPAQLRSIALQNRPPDEMVICDDGSRDATLEIAAKFAHSAPFEVRLVQNASNLGSTRNFAQAISLCESSIISLADQDDVWFPDKLQSIEDVFLFSPDTVAVFSNADLIGPDSLPLEAQLWDSFLFPTSERHRFANGDALRVLIKHPVVTGATMAFRADLRPLLLPIPPEHLHDRWLSFLLAACGPFIPISTPLMEYRCHSAQQIGPGHGTFSARFEQASITGSDFYNEEIIQFQQLAERLERHRSEFLHAHSALSEIAGKIMHRQHRARLPLSTLARFPKVLGEVLNGGYWRYSEGWQSIAKDIAGISSRNSLPDAPQQARTP